MGCTTQLSAYNFVKASGTHTVMAPRMEKSSTFEKCHKDSSDSKQGKFSFRWLLRRSKSSKTAKEMIQDENPVPITVPTSKSCDSGITNLSTVDKCSTFLLWRLLPTRGKSPMHCDNTNLVKDSIASSTRSFKTSFSCGDVYGLLSKSQKPIMTKSNQNIPSAVELNESQPFNPPSQSSVSLDRWRKSVQCLNATAQSCGQLISNDVVPNVFHLVLCKLCLTMVPASKMYSLEDCGCIFCIVCMQQYLLFNIKEGNVEITCPDADCIAGGKVLMTEVHNLVGDEAFYLFQRFKLDREIEQDPNRTWCPAAGCETVCSIRPSTNSDKGTAVHCHNCSLTFCSACKEQWHSNRTCEELRKFLSEEEEFQFSDDEDSSIKRCPNCHIPIERDEGCAQMMCKRCKHVFCWHCLASLDDDFLLRHYDKGPCRNKLGHSRASMVWHRTQVVGIFAGFSFLLLMASPILLLAAPCLLCCRCKNCKFFYEEPTPL